MNDDNNDGTPRAASRRRTAVVAGAVGVAGLVAGGVAAGAISAASADSGSGHRYGAPGRAGRPPGGAGDWSQPQRGDEKLLTGTTKDKVLAAVRVKYPDATVQRVETDYEGVYEAHVVDAGAPLIVQVGKDFTVTGTQAGGGPGGPGVAGGGRGPGNGDGLAGRPEQGQRPAPPSGSGSRAEGSSTRVS